MIALAGNRSISGRDLLGDLRVRDLISDLERFLDLGRRVIDQAERRIVREEKVPADDKLVSIFEPHTRIIVCGKANKPVEFGRKILLEETPSGLVTRYAVLEGNPRDSEGLDDVAALHAKKFGSPPRELAADRGFYDKAKIDDLKRDVRRVSIPKPGSRTKAEARAERSRGFRAGQRFRTGIEGRISSLKRGRGIRRCPWRRERSFIAFVGLCVLVNNLAMIAGALLM